jgi:hypothetical protein
MKHILDGYLVVEVPAEPDGSIPCDASRLAAGLPQNVGLILQLPDGTQRIIKSPDTTQMGHGLFIAGPEHSGSPLDYEANFRPSAEMRTKPSEPTGPQPDES